MALKFVLFYFFFFLLEIRFGSKGGVAPVDDQTEVSSLLGKRKTDFAFFKKINIVRFITFSVLNV